MFGFVMRVVLAVFLLWGMPHFSAGAEEVRDEPVPEFTEPDYEGADYSERTLRYLQYQKGKIEERLRESDAVEQELAKKYADYFNQYYYARDQYKEYPLNLLTRTIMKKQAAIPEYRAECAAMLEVLDELADSVAANPRVKVVNDIAVRIREKFLNESFDDFVWRRGMAAEAEAERAAWRAGIDDAEAAAAEAAAEINAGLEAAILAEAESRAAAARERQSAEYDRFMREGEEHMEGGRYGEAEASFSLALLLEGYEEDGEARARLLAARTALTEEQRERNSDEYIRLMEDGKGHLSDALASFTQAMRLGGYGADSDARTGVEAAREFAGRSVLACSPDANVEMAFSLIPSGTFVMGAPPVETGGEYDELQHTVTLTKEFYLGVKEVTQAQYEAVMGTNPSHFKGDDLPVECVSWEDAAEFCRRMSATTGRNLRLPTEAEWEYACRAGTTTPFYFGETIDTVEANYDGRYTYADGYTGVDGEATRLVGMYLPNVWGLYDMHGNVREWCSDIYGRYPEGDVTDPEETEGQSYPATHVVRGGSWKDAPRNCRSANRESPFDPDGKENTLGFRVALDLN